MSLIIGRFFLTILFFVETDTADFYKKFDHYEAIASYDSALILIEKELAHNPTDYFKSHLYRCKARIFCLTHRSDLCIEYYTLANQIATELNDTSEMAKSTLGIGAGYHFKSQLDSAVHYYLMAKPLLKTVNDLENLNGIENNLGLIFNTKGNYNEAEKYLIPYLNHSLISHDSLSIANAYYNLGLIKERRGFYELSLSYYDSSLQIAQSKKLTLGISKAYKGKARVLTLLKRYDQAIVLFNKYDSIATQFLHEDYSDKILELETKFRTAEIERDNAIKQAQIEVQDQRMIYLYAIASFLICGMIGIYLYNEQRKKVIRALATQKNQENEQRINDLLSDQELKSAYAMLAGQEKAHKRIAQELHDNLGSILVTLNMFADSLQNKKDPEALKQLASRISEVAQQANETTRQISHSLDSGVLKHFGLEIAVKELMNALGDSGSIQVENHVQITSQLDSELSMNIYRIIQELVNNTLKHSKASKITLELNQIKDHLSLIYYDNGVGFIKEEIEPGMGLKNLESRVDNLDGSITIDSQLNKGTTTIIDVPVS